jgi:hypothetical protein
LLRGQEHIFDWRKTSLSKENKGRKNGYPLYIWRYV